MYARLNQCFLKFDKFLADDSADSTKKEYVRSVIGLADSLGMTAVAEYVETADQREILESSNIGFMQGYLFGKPQKEEDFEVYIRQ